MEKQDLTVYGPKELELIVFNTPMLYAIRRSEWTLKRTLDYMYEYTHEQWKTLSQALWGELEEMEKTEIIG